MPKRSIRQNLLLQRRSLVSDERLRLSRSAQNRLIDTDLFRQARLIALYSPIHGEVETQTLLATALHNGRQVCFPRVNDETLEFVLVDGPGDLARGAFGVTEPVGTSVVAAAELDLAVMPGVGFDRSGFRLGYGGGYYDRAFSVGRPKRLAGLAFGFQLIEELPAEDHDVRLDLVVTDSEVLAFTTI